MKSILAGLGSLGAGKLAALAATGAATLGLLLYLIMQFGGAAPMALLYNDLDLRDAGAMTDLLDKTHIPHRADNGGATLLVPNDRVAEARLALAKDGLPSGGSIGYEIFDRGDNLTANQFQQDINQTRALEGELSRSIRLLRGVRGVRVHLVLARHEPFAQEQQQAQASVLLTMSGVARMDREGVQAVLNLVAASVPGLKPQNIAIIDNRGELLARAGQPSDDGAAAAATGDELRRSTEIRLAHEVEEMLERSLGTGHVRAQAAVVMDFDQSHETNEKYNPDGQVARSTQSITDSTKSTEKDPSVSVQNNLPNPDPGGASATGSQQQRQEETTNYEIEKTVRTVVHDQPQIQRISLAVMVDGMTAAGPDGKPVYKERSADDLARIASLVRGAIGFDEKRGDKVEIVSMRFNAEIDAAGTAATGLFGLSLDKGDIMRIAQMALLGGIALIIALAVLRPAVLRLTAVGADRIAAHGSPAVLGAAGQALLDGPNTSAGLLTDESMINLGNVEGQIKASSIRRIAELINQQPAASVAIMRGWLAQEAG